MIVRAHNTTILTECKLLRLVPYKLDCLDLEANEQETNIRQSNIVKSFINVC